MFDDDVAPVSRVVTTTPSATVASWITALTGLDRSVDDAERVTQIELLERLKSAAAAAQAVVTADFAASQRAEQRSAGVPADRVGQGIGAQVGLARRDSPFRGGRHLGLAQALTCELPQTMAALRAGDTTEWRATILARETACLTPADRRLADAELGPHLGSLGDREVEARARATAYRLDPHAFMARTRGATGDRRVSLRPAPDTMSRLTGFLPVAQGVAAYTALTHEADRIISAGDPRGRGQIMADLMIERLTGQASTAATPVEVHVVMSEASLFGTCTFTDSDSDTDTDGDTDGDVLGGGSDRGDASGNGSPGDLDEPAIVIGAGPIPAQAARDLLRDTSAQVWLRRVYARPGDGTLIAMDSRQRIFPAALRQLLLIRDQHCRTPWCGAPIRHADHVTPHAAGGATSAANGQGLCAACNYAKQAPGWHADPGPQGAGQRVDLTTPTGRTHTSHPPPLPGARPPHLPSATDAADASAASAAPSCLSAIELGLRRLLDAA